MVREVRNTLGSTNLPDPISRPQPLRVEARAVDTAVIGTTRDSTFDSFISGLSTLNPALQRFAQNRMDEQNRQEVEQGKQDAILKEEPKSDAELYQHGYLKIKGTNAAAEDMAELQGYLETNYNPDTDDFQGTVKGWLKTKASPSTDKSFLEGYAPIMDRAINQLSNQYTKQRWDKLQVDVATNAMKNLSLGMGAFVDQGLPVPDEFITAKKQEFATNFKMSEAKFEELQFLAAKEFGNKGNFTIFEQFKKDKPDGTPGMYFNPAWKEKIDAAVHQAQVVYLQQSQATEKQWKKDREQRQEQALQSVFTGALTGEYGDAVAQFKKVVTEQPNLFLPSEISEWTNKLSGLSKMSQLEETTEQRVNATNLLARIYSGRAGIQDVMNESLSRRISYSQTQQLLNDVNSFQTSQRQLAATEAANQYSIYKTTEFKSAEEYLNATLDRTPGLVERIDPAARTYYKQAKATAILEFTQRAQGLQPSEIPKLTQEILERYSKSMSSVISISTEEGTAAIVPRGPNSGLLRFQSPRELKEAHQRGQISDADFQYQYNIFKEIRQERLEQERKAAERAAEEQRKKDEKAKGWW